jgi:hypothetical protein
MRHVDPQRHRMLFRVGIALVVVSMPMGWVGLLVFAALAAARGEARWIWGALINYALSWALLGVGVLIGGNAAVTKAREILRRRRRLREILRLRRCRREADRDPTPAP